MKRPKDYTIELLIALFLFAAVTSYPGCYSDKQVHSSNDACNYNMANDKNAFHVGDTLYPDYAHSDTLIVTDIASADSLNWLFYGG